MEKCIVTTLALIGLLGAAGLPATAGTPASTDPPMAFGIDAAGVPALTGLGARPDYATMWIGPWTLTSGWGGPDAQLASLSAAGVTPAVHFYYWGDDISPACVENGCWSSLHGTQKDAAHWAQLADQLTAHLKSKLGGKPALVFLESEFNKGGISTYEPFDGDLTDMAHRLKAAYPAAKVVLSFGNWDSGNWGTFDRAAAASDYTGIQGMRGSTRDSLATYQGLYTATLAGAQRLQTLFHKPIVLTDLALSSYPEPAYLSYQATELRKFFAGLDALQATGVAAMLYRSWNDAPGMDLANYYGEAERHWGLAYPGGAQKEAGKAWLQGVAAERSGAGTSTASAPAAPTGSGTVVQAEAFATRTVGGRQADAAASGGYAWNLWSNGELRHQVAAPTGSVQLAVRARATTSGGIPAHMDVYADGARVLSVDPATQYQEFKAAVQSDGAIDVRIVYGNDAVSATGDRNLVVDTLRVGGGFTPTVTVSPASNAWWEEVAVQADRPVAAMAVSIGGGAWHPMTLQSWGHWTANERAPAGTPVAFRATASDGQTATTPAKPWLVAA